MNYSTFGFGNFSPFGGFGMGMFVGAWAIFVVVMLAAIALKGFALWRAARNDHKGWFILMLIVNLVGIPEIIYLLTTGKEEKTTPIVTVEEKK